MITNELIGMPKITLREFQLLINNTKIYIHIFRLFKVNIKDRKHM